MVTMAETMINRTAVAANRRRRRSTGVMCFSTHALYRKERVLLTFAGVGLGTNIRELAKQGWRPLIVGVVGECAIAALTLTMVLVAARLFEL